MRTAAATSLKQRKHQQLEQRGDDLAQKIQTVQVECWEVLGVHFLQYQSLHALGTVREV